MRASLRGGCLGPAAPLGARSCAPPTRAFSATVPGRPPPDTVERTRGYTPRMSHGDAASASVAADRPPATGALVLDEDAGLFEAGAPPRGRRGRDAPLAGLLRLRPRSLGRRPRARGPRGGLRPVVARRGLIPR